MNSQPSLNDTVHVIYSSSDSFLVDDNMNIIETNKNIFNAKYLSDISFSSNDYTLNSLLDLLPEKIYIHVLDNYIDEFVSTIEAIFENRVIICNECDICKLYKNQKHSFFKKH